jgi:hypothetical protein
MADVGISGDADGASGGYFGEGRGGEGGVGEQAGEKL